MPANSTANAALRSASSLIALVVAASICLSIRSPSALASALAFSSIVAADLLGVAAAFFQDRADLVLRIGQLFFIVGEQILGLLIGLVGLEDLIGDMLFPLVETLGQRSPGEFPEDDHKHQEHDGGPDRQIAFDLLPGHGNRIDIAFLLAGRGFAGMRRLVTAACCVSSAKAGTQNANRARPIVKLTTIRINILPSPCNSRHFDLFAMQTIKFL